MALSKPPVYRKCVTAGCGGCEDDEFYPIADGPAKPPVAWRKVCGTCKIRPTLDDDFPQCGPCAAGVPLTAKRGPLVGRNDPCRCGSGRKFKKCCLRG